MSILSTFLEGSCSQVRRLLQVVFPLLRRPGHFFLDYTYARLLRDMVWYMHLWSTLRIHSVLRSKSRELRLQKVSTTASQALGAVFLGSANRYIHGRGYTYVKSFASWILSFILHQQVQAMRLPCNGPCRFLTGLYIFMYEMLNEEKALQAVNAVSFWNPIINNGLEAEGKRELDASMEQYSKTSNLLKEYLVNDRKRVWTGALRQPWIYNLDVCGHFPTWMSRGHISAHFPQLVNGTCFSDVSRSPSCTQPL